MSQENIEKFMEALPGKNSHPWRGLTRYLHQLKEHGFLSEGIKERVTEVSKRFGILSGQRYAENFAPMISDPKFDQDEYYRLFVLSHLRFGLRAGDRFSFSYHEMQELGYSPQSFYDLMDQACESAGNKSGDEFAGWYALTLPRAVKAGIDPDSFRIGGKGLLFAGNVRVAKAFLINAPIVVQRGGIDLTCFTNLATEAVHRLKGGGLKANNHTVAYWGILNSGGVSRLNHPLDAYIDDLVRIREGYGSPGAQWFASGFNGLGETAFKIDEYITSAQDRINAAIKNERQFPRYMIEESTKHFGELKEMWERRALELSYDSFKRPYLQLLASLGLRSAVFYSMYTRLPKNVTNRVNSMDQFQQIPTALEIYSALVPRQVYEKALWQIPKFNSSRKKIAYFLHQVKDMVETDGNEYTISSLDYTRRWSRRFKIDSKALHRGKPVQEIATYNQEKARKEQEWADFLDRTRTY